MKPNNSCISMDIDSTKQFKDKQTKATKMQQMQCGQMWAKLKGNHK